MNLVKEYLGKVSVTVEKDYWSSDKSYDRLVIVEVLNVGCYISRRAVPRGKSYSDREYWIRMSKAITTPPSPEPTDFPIVTEFGDSVEVAVAQKTITDKIDELDTNVTVLRETDDMLSDDIRDARTTLRREINYVSEDVSEKYNEYLRSSEEVNGQINALETRLVSQSSSINELTNNLVNTNEKVNKLYRKIKDNEFIQYIGGRITNDTYSDTTYINNLKNKFGANTLGYFVVPAIEFDQIIDNIEQHIATDISRMKALIIQYDTNWKTIGDASDIPDKGDEDYSNMYSGLVTIIDKINAANPNCRVFLVAPPNAQIREDSEFNDNITDKIEALKDICTLTNAIFINPNEAGYHPRYSEVFVESEIYSETHTYIPVIDIDYTEKWYSFITNKVLETL